MSEIVLTEQNFEQEVLLSGKAVLVDFWANWCGPCRMLAPILSEIAEEYEGKAVVGKVNVDEQPGLAAQFRVSSIPTVVLFKNGRAVNTLIGLRPKAEFEALLG